MILRALKCSVYNSMQICSLGHICLDTIQNIDKTWP